MKDPQPTTSVTIVEQNHCKNMEADSMQTTLKQKPKRFRSAFTTEQIKYLEEQFKKFPYINSEHRKEIATALDMQDRAIKIWFQNRRMKEKKDSVNYETNGKMQKLSNDHLINVCSVPTTNEQVSYTTPLKVNNDNIYSNNIPPQVPQNLSINHNKILITANQNQNIVKNVPTESCRNVDLMQPSSTPKETFETNNPIINKTNSKIIDLTTKLKRDVNHLIYQKHKPNVFKKMVPGLSKSAKKVRSFNDLSSRKRLRSLHASSKPKQTTVNSPAYYPMMPTVYAHPFMSSGGMIWKPVNLSSVVPPPPPLGVPSTSLGQGKINCNCNCHSNAQPFTLPSNPISPFAQYVITSPFQNPTPKY